MSSDRSKAPHQAVLVREVVALLEGKAVVVDATVGAGGHAEALLEAGVGSVVGLDRDAVALDIATGRLARFGARFRPVHARFSELAEAAARLDVPSRRAGGVLYDLGVSSMQLDEGARGFSFRAEAPLDMRMDRGGRPTAADIVNTYPEVELARVIFEHGEERHSRRIARAIVRARSRSPIQTTSELAAIVAGAVPRRSGGRGGRGGPHPARRTFQAIRIEVNAELEELAASLPQAVSLLEPRGRLVVISYHSLEDRIVKRFVAGDPSLAPVTKKPVRPQASEQADNPRARSARLRAAEWSERTEEAA
jgi:16S rRNA (cytosine1402-N4)-methyltransferase